MCTNESQMALFDEADKKPRCHLLDIFSYKIVLDNMPNDFQKDVDIAKAVVDKINAKGPFERGEFEVCDAVSMLHELSFYQLIEVDRRHRAWYGDISLKDHYYRSLYN